MLGKIDNQLYVMLNETKASRAYLVQYHNGGKGLNKQSFLKMSTTNEQVQLGVKPYMPELKDQFRSVLAYFTREININGFCYIPNISSIKDDDASMFEFMKSRGVVAQFGYSIKDYNKTVIAFVCLEYLDTPKVDVSLINNCFEKHIEVFQTLLNK